MEFFKWLAEQIKEWRKEDDTKNWKFILGFLVSVLLIIIFLNIKLNVYGVTIVDCRETDQMKELISVAQKIYFDYRTDQLNQADAEYRVSDFERAAKIYRQISQDCEKDICNKIKLKINSYILNDAKKLFDEQDWKNSCDKFRSFFSTLN